MPKLRVLHYQTNPGGIGYFRLDVPRMALIKRGDVEMAYITSDDRMSGGLKTVEQFLGYIGAIRPDVIHLPYTTELADIEKLVAARHVYGIPFIVDFDDDMRGITADNAAIKAYYNETSQYTRNLFFLLRMADACTTTKQNLADKFADDVRKAYVVPNCYSPDHWEHDTIFRRKRDDSVNIGFAAGLNRMGDLLQAKEQLVYALERYPEVRCLFVTTSPDWAVPYMSNKSKAAANRCFHARGGPPNIFRSAIIYYNAEIFISPLSDAPFNDYKTSIKAFDAVGGNSAFLCDDMGAYEDVPTSCAVKVKGATEWKHAFDELVPNAEYRAKLAANLKDWAHDTYHVDKHIDKWVNLYQEVVAKGPVSSEKELKQGVKAWQSSSLQDPGPAQSLLQKDSSYSASLSCMAIAGWAS